MEREMTRNEILAEISECDCSDNNPCEKCKQLEKAYRKKKTVYFYEGFSE